MDDFERRMEALKARFIERAAADRAALDQAWAARDDDAIRRISHSLAGNAGMFGFSDLGEAARELEEALDRTVPEDQLQAKLDAVLAKIPAKSG
jgi:HPt (histidine-containing phosphotransfer) domain-containing protein